MRYIVLCLLFLSILNSASFDCKKALSQIEKIICSNKKISQLDDCLSSTYKNTKSIFTIEDKSVIIRNQRGWIKIRNNCSKSKIQTKCLEDLYLKRIIELQNYKKNYFNNFQVFEYHDSNNEGFISLKLLSTNSYFLKAESYYDIHNNFGPNIGIIESIVESKDNKIVYKNKSYILVLKRTIRGIVADENEMGPFGLNVSFAGEYLLKD